MTPPPPRSPLFPYTTLFRSRGTAATAPASCRQPGPSRGGRRARRGLRTGRRRRGRRRGTGGRATAPRSEEHTSDSSHGYISYAVFCLKKKKKQKNSCQPTTD